MIFPNYGTLGRLAICIAPIVFGVLLYRLVRSNRPSVKVPARALGILLCLCGGLLSLLYGCMSAFSATEYSSALYSPNHRYAIRVENWDAGALGGITSVILYSRFGLITKTIFSGEYAQTDKATIRWLNNSEVSIDYYIDPYESSRPPFCEGTGTITVSCRPIEYKDPRTIQN